ncbi:response regulator [Fundidesulfovibrio terrae]|uniref:response regulator n=1 Tax=Fundidesulfovibrio terrae TaxID=2922866 RepID=UPI001FAF67B0|nr:response regulator [Fundidesulfovibrio terrae]
MGTTLRQQSAARIQLPAASVLGTSEIRARRLAAICGLATAGVGGLGLAAGLTGWLFLSSLVPGYVPMALSTSLLLVLMGAGLACRSLPRPDGRWRAALLWLAAGSAMAVGLLVILGYFLRVSANPLDFLAHHIQALLAIPFTPMSPATASFFLLGGTGLFLLGPDGAPASVDDGRGHGAGLFGAACILAGLTCLLGYLYGSPLFYGSRAVPVAASTALGFLILGHGIVFAAGERRFPLRLLSGGTVQARLMRTFPPVLGACILLYPMLSVFILRSVDINTALLHSIWTVVFLSLSIAVVVHAGRTIGGSVDRAEELQRLAEARLQRAVAAAEAASVVKSEFLANMSHEIRTPLNGLLGMLQILETTHLDDEQRECVDMAIRSGNRLTRLLGDILDLSRIEAGRMNLYERTFTLEDILSSIAETFQPLSHEARLPLNISVDPDTPRVLVGDDVRIRQVLFNFVGNAMKFTTHGEVRVEVHPLTPPKPGMARLLFVVADTGMGIPDDKISLVCDPFTQLENDYTRTRQGAGLGLSIAKHLVDLMRGSLTIDSVEGHGTTVYCSLPLGLPREGAALAGEQAYRAAYEAWESGLRLLLVEDEAVNRMSMQRLLEKRGHEVATARDGQEALEAVAAGDFDLVLMDIQMPVMNGLEATRKIRTDRSIGNKARIPIVAMTAYAMAGDRERFLAAGMDDYVSKPVRISELAEVIRRVLAGR